MLWDKFPKNQVFSLKSCFLQNFNWSNLIFDQSKSCFKKFCGPLPGLIDQTCFSINRRLYFRFFKNSSLTVSKHLFQKFFNFSSRSDLARQHYEFFCRFPPKFLQVFPPSKLVRPFYPSFCFYFHVFMHIFMHLKGIFGPL